MNKQQEQIKYLESVLSGMKELGLDSKFDETIDYTANRITSIIGQLKLDISLQEKELILKEVLKSLDSDASCGVSFGNMSSSVARRWNACGIRRLYERAKKRLVENNIPVPKIITDYLDTNTDYLSD